MKLFASFRKKKDVEPFQPVQPPGPCIVFKPGAQLRNVSIREKDGVITIMCNDGVMITQCWIKDMFITDGGRPLEGEITYNTFITKPGWVPPVEVS